MRSKRTIARTASVLMVAALMETALLAGPGQAQTATVPAPTPPTHLQVWSINIAQYRNAWQGFVARAATNEFAPDLILAQEMPSTGSFVSALEGAVVGSDYDARHSGNGNNAIIWNRNRLSLVGTRTWEQGTSSCPDMANGAPRYAIAGKFNDLLDPLGRNVVGASVHWAVGLSNNCLVEVNNKANDQIETQWNQRWMTVLAGDFNERPDARGELPTNGLETDPNCWYRKMTPAQDNVSPISGDNCGGSGYDRYYDTVWVHPGSGGGTNPTATSFCEQYTFNNDLAMQDVDLRDATNSCTDLVRNNDPNTVGMDGLDKGRIDYIWTSYEDANGTAWRPPAAAIAPFVTYASADLGQSLDAANLATFYADHRAVQALLAWPPPPVILPGIGE